MTYGFLSPHGSMGSITQNFFRINVYFASFDQKTVTELKIMTGCLVTLITKGNVTFETNLILSRDPL